MVSQRGVSRLSAEAENNDLTCQCLAFTLVFRWFKMHTFERLCSDSQDECLNVLCDMYTNLGVREQRASNGRCVLADRNLRDRKVAGWCVFLKV